jgi:spore maturation protein CgeB
LKHEDEREAIAQRGYERTMQEHMMDNRFEKLLERIRLMKLT